MTTGAPGGAGTARARGDGVTADARQPGHTLCCVNPPRYSHALNTERVLNRDWAPLSITNKSRKYLILGPAREILSKSVSSGEPLLLLSRTSARRRLTQRCRGLSRRAPFLPCAAEAGGRAAAGAGPDRDVTMLKMCPSSPPVVRDVDERPSSGVELNVRRPPACCIHRAHGRRGPAAEACARAAADGAQVRGETSIRRCRSASEASDPKRRRARAPT